MAISVNRGGVTSSTWYETGISAALKTQGKEVQIECFLNSKGGGETHVQVSIPASEFQELASKMLAASESDAIRAFGAALSEFKKFDDEMGEYIDGLFEM